MSDDIRRAWVMNAPSAFEIARATEQANASWPESKWEVVQVEKRGDGYRCWAITFKPAK